MSQVYALLIRAEGSTQVGSLGLLEFGGTYVYVGSARGRAGPRRIERHADIAEGRREGRFWHIDHLLRLGQLEAIVSAETVERQECAVASRIAQVAAEAVPGFGSSDCRCRSHLFRVDEHDAVSTVSRVMAELGLRPQTTFLSAASR
jgi:Uri superfamily endonuclease